MRRRALAFLLLAAPLLAAALGAVSSGTPAIAAASPPQCLTNLVANVTAGKPSILPAAPCTDPDGDALTIILVDGPQHGVLGAQAADGTRTYTADASYVGTDVVRFKATDGTSESAISTLTINVHPGSASPSPGNPQDLGPADPQGVEPASDPVDPRRCAGRGPSRPKNGLMVGTERRPSGWPLTAFRADGRGKPRKLTDPYHRVDSWPAWSPDGRRVAFERAAGSVNELWTVNVASGRERRLVRRGVSPTWSPDGRWIAFGGRDGLTAIRPDGTGERLIGTTYRSVEQPSWSPNGRCLAGRAYDEGGLGDNLGLAIMDSRGGSPHVILRYDPRFVTTTNAAPSWSHDGRHLLIVGQTTFTRRSSNRLVRVNVDGTSSRTLTRYRDISHAVYSPDGRTIAFSRRKLQAGADKSTDGVYTMPAKGGRSRLVIPGRFAAAWGPRAASRSSAAHPRSRAVLGRDR
jgi:hypothetical protein